MKCNYCDEREAVQHISRGDRDIYLCEPCTKLYMHDAIVTMKEEGDHE